MLINNSIFFIHIPRTAGRYVKTLLKNYYYQDYKVLEYEFK